MSIWKEKMFRVRTLITDVQDNILIDFVVSLPKDEYIISIYTYNVKKTLVLFYKKWGNIRLWKKSEAGNRA